MPIAGRLVAVSAALLLSLAFCALVGIVGTALWLGERAQTYTAKAIEIRDTRRAAEELRSALQAAESSQRGFLATGNEIYLAPFDTAKSQATIQLKQLQQELADNPQRAALVQRLSINVAEKLAEMNETVSLKTSLHDNQAMALLRSNRGKALMDEINVFLSALIIAADEDLTAGVNQQQGNAALLRAVSVAGAILIILIGGGLSFLVHRYTRELAAARDEVRELNLTLEDRVEERTKDLKEARDNAAVLLTEVNHRVANSLTLLASMVRLQSSALKDDASKDILSEIQSRILAISLVHKKLYTSGDVRYVALNDYLAGLVEHIETSMRAEGYSARLAYTFEPLRMRTDRSVYLGVVTAEWIANAFKYAYPDRSGEIRIRLETRQDGDIELVVEDDGVGRKEATVAHKGTGIGTKIVQSMAGSLRGRVEYLKREPGLAAKLIFPLGPNQ
jgi:two-component sensor histidine kinase/CHASE3 domain sensor protein